MTGFNSKRQMAANKLQEPWNEDEWRRNNWRCVHGWLRGEQCESCNAPQPPSEWAGIKAILDEYGLQAIDFVADFKAAMAQPAQEPVREALKLALEALNDMHIIDFPLEDIRNWNKAITAIKETLAQPPQRQWIWLSDADIAEVVDTTCQYTGGYEEYLIKKAERKIKELNT